MEVEIERRPVGETHPPFIVAEISANHGQSLEKAIHLIHEAKKAGAEAVKFQAYTPDSMTLDSDAPAYHHLEKSLWSPYSLYQLYEKAHTPYAWFETLFQESRRVGLIPFCSVFDDSSVDFLESFSPPCYKIASLEIVHHPLLRKVAQTKKPILLSTGGSTLQEIQEAIDVIHSENNRKIILLKCVTAYPAPIQESNLLTLPDMKSRFNTPIGLSDHTTNSLTSLLSIPLGAGLIEKHFTLSRQDQEIDAAFSLEPQELKELVEQSKLAHQAIGTVHYGPTLHETENLSFRRSLICTKNIQKGEIFSAENIHPLRPNIGLAPKYYPTILGRKARISHQKGDPITWDSIS